MFKKFISVFPNLVHFEIQFFSFLANMTNIFSSLYIGWRRQVYLMYVQYVIYRHQANSELIMQIKAEG